MAGRIILSACIPSSSERSIHAPRLDCNTKFSTGTRVRPYRCTRVGNSTVDLSIDLPQSYIRVRLHAQDLNLDLQRCTHPAVCVHTHTGRSTDLPDVYTAVCVHTHLLFFVFSQKKSTPSPRLNCVIIEFSSNLFSVKGVLCF